MSMMPMEPKIIIADVTKTHHIPLYRILLHNDSVNDMLHVMRALQEVFKLKDQDAARIMLEAHETGVALCSIEPLEKAELRQGQLQSFSLTATIEPED